MKISETIVILYTIEKDILTDAVNNELGILEPDKLISSILTDAITAAFNMRLLSSPAEVRYVYKTSQLETYLETKMLEYLPEVDGEVDVEAITLVVIAIWTQYYLHGISIYNLFRKTYPSLITHFVSTIYLLQTHDELQLHVTVDKMKFDKELPNL